MVPLAGRSVRGAVWALANGLGVVARTPAELFSELLVSTPRTELVLTELAAARDPRGIAELAAALGDVLSIRPDAASPARSARHPPGEMGHVRVVVEGPDEASDDGPDAAGEAPSGADTATGLDDPAAVCAADPVAVTAGYEAGPGDHGGLRTAWLRAGQSLTRDQPPAARALVLLAALGDDADPRLRPVLRGAAAETGADVVWARHRGDVTPPWPGPVAALGTVPQVDLLLLADDLGTVHVLHAADAHPAAAPLPTGLRPRALAPLPDGRVLVLDERGQAHVVPVARTVPGGGPSGMDRLTAAVSTTLVRHPGTTLAAAGGTVLVGDRMGSVHAFGLDGVHQAALHSGRVTALAALPGSGGAHGVAHAYSGGADGTVRGWPVGGEPLPAPITERGCPVVALHAAATATGPALAIGWRDGLVAFHRLGTAAPALTFRPGPPVRAVAVLPDASVAIGTDESLTVLRQRV